MTDALACLHDQTVMAHAQGRLEGEARETADEHARACARCRDKLEAAARSARLSGSATSAHTDARQVRPREAPRLDDDGASVERGASIGRYTVLALIGRGGMGEVYAAYDPELDRKVALKLLLGARHADDGRSQLRLLREAKAIARLSHANVVVVHDAGTFADRVFVAMEFVDGQTLKDWLAEAPRTRREILDVFTLAARGLAAAHAAGLVHRDFKPHNVMVGKDGSVRVMDFGLAREIGSDPEPDEGASRGSDDVRVDGPSPRANVEVGVPTSTREAGATLTLTGELVGTPLYMAPEQFRAGRTDARTDQFSFCVALYQALYGAHPFGGETLEVLLTRVLGGLLQPVPARHDVPTWLRKVLLRGLSVEPAGRWPSMPALIAALDDDPARARRRWGATAGVTLLVAAATVTLVRGPRRAESMCRGGPARFAAIWEPAGAPGTSRPRRDAVAAAFLGSGSPAAREIWERVAPRLDRYVDSWLAMYRDACEATQVRGEQSAGTLDLRMACLDERRITVGALTDVLQAADRTVVAAAVDAVNALPTLETCADLRLLRTEVEPPRDEATRARVDDLRRRLAVAKALNDTGQHPRALAQAQALEREARAVGYRPMLAEILTTTGAFQDSFAKDAQRSADRLAEGALTALAVKRDDVAAQAGALLVGVTGYYLNRHDEGRRWASFTRAVLERLGPGHDVLQAWVLQAEAYMKLQENDPAPALALARQAVALKEKALVPDHPDIAIGREAEAEALIKMGKAADALAINDKVVATFLAAYGPTSSQVARALSNRGEYLTGLGRNVDAVATFRDSLARWEAQAGTDDPVLAYPLTGLGRALVELGRSREAVAPLERALALRATDTNPALLAETRLALARARGEMGAGVGVGVGAQHR